jgi:hypothetical protein
MNAEPGAEHDIETLGTDELMEESDIDLGGEDEGGDDDLGRR